MTRKKYRTTLICMRMNVSVGVKAEGTMEMQLEKVANQLAIEYWQDNKKSILGLIAKYDEYNIEEAFRSRFLQINSQPKHRKTVQRQK